MAEHEANNNDQSPDDIDIRGYIKSAVNKLGPNVSKEEKKEHAKLLVKIFEEGMTPKDAMKITDDEMAQMYSYAYHLCSTQKYEEALDMFKMLFTLDPSNPDFSTAVGVCHHRLQHYDYAIQCYLVSSILAPQNPISLFYAYDCYMKLNEVAPAGIMLCNVIARAGDQPLYAKVKKDAQAFLDQMQQKIILENAQAEAVDQTS